MVPTMGVNIHARDASIGVDDTITESAVTTISTWVTGDLAKLQKVAEFVP